MLTKNQLSPELIAEGKRFRTRLIIIATVLLLLLAALIGGKPIYHWGKRWRARQLAAQAEAALDAGRWEEASGKARAAYQLTVEEPAALRAVARVEGTTGQPAEAISFWQHLDQMHALTLRDRQYEADDLLHSGDLPGAAAQNQILLAQSPNDPAILRQAARIASAAGDYPNGLQYATHALAAAPDNLEGKLLLALLKLHARDQPTRQAGLDSALQLTQDQGNNGLQALVYLASMRELPPADAPTVIARLRAHPLATEDQRLLALDVQIHIQPDARASIIDHAFAQYQNADPLKKRAFALWLNSHGLYDRTLDLIPLADATRRRDLLLVYLDALAALKRWSDIENILAQKDVALDDFYTELFLARSAIELGQSTIASLHWTRAHQAAAPSVEEMWYLGEYAEKIGQTDQAQRAYDSLKNNATTARPACEALLRLAQKTGDDQTVRQILAEMHQRWPHDDAVSNDAVYFNLLKGADLKADLATARDLVERSPASLAHRTTLALAYYRLNDGPSALGVYSGLQIPWDQVPANNRAVYAAVLGLAGNAGRARSEAGAVRVAELRPEERQLIQPWLSP